jgi:hypothetical protein
MNNNTTPIMQSSNVLNQLFFNISNPKENLIKQLINDLSKYMLTNKNMDEQNAEVAKILDNSSIQPTQEMPEVKIPHANEETFRGMPDDGTSVGSPKFAEGRSPYANVEEQIVCEKMPRRAAVGSLLPDAAVGMWDLDGEESSRLEDVITNQGLVDVQTTSDPPRSVVPPSSTPKEEKIRIFMPKQKDTLFWCLYVITQGFQEYYLIHNNYAVKELEIKTQIVNYIKSNPSKLKETNYKMTKANIQEIMSELLTSQTNTSFMVLLAMCCFYNINIVIVFSKNRIMLEFISDRSSTATYYTVYKDEYKKYSTDSVRRSKEEIDKMKTKMICVENYTKPLKSMSYYKVNELVEMAKKLQLYDKDKCYNKTELYELVGQAFLI